MIITQQKNKVVASHDFESVNCTIDAEDMRYVASLLRNNYSNTRLAVVREITANALDANIEAQADRQIEVKLPTSMNPTFSVRDFGGGLSQEDVFGLYSKYGKSTKRTSNNYIGAFGIGKFAPLSYGENFTCVSYHGGVKKTYNIFVNDDDDTKIAMIGEAEPTDEPTGLSIQVAVANEDISNFREVVQSFFKFFPQNDMPKFIGVEDDFIKTPKKLLESKKGDWFFSDEDKGYYRSTSHIIMGRVSYPIDSSSISVENYISDENNRRIIEQLLNESNFYLRVPLGLVKLHHSREALEYNKSTQKEICRSLLSASKEIQEIAKEKLADSSCLFQAKKNYARVVNALPYQMKRVFENSFEWNGIQIDSSVFDRPYDHSETLIITRYEKELDKNSRNGFKVQASKTNRVYCQDNALFMIQNLESSHGNNLRVRTLMNEDENLQEVYIIRPTNDEAEVHVWNDEGWNFKLIDKKFIKFSSDIEKEKIVRNKVSGTKSRASIPLFKMKTDKGYGHRQADYWQNVSDPINSIEIDNIQGSVDGKLIYVPIQRYQIDHEYFDLERVYNMYKAILRVAEDNSEQKNCVLFGVRKGDVKKLDDDVWVSFFDFYLDICKKIILANLNDGELAYKRLQLQNDNSLSDYKYNLGRLFNNKTFQIDLPDDHALMQAKNQWVIYDSQGIEMDQKLINAVNYVKSNDKGWLSNQFGTIDPKQFNENFKSLVSKYPLLRAIGESVDPHWGKLNDDDQTISNKKVLDYISLCDNANGEES